MTAAEQTLTDSRRDFMDIVVPVSLPVLGGGEVIPVEDVSAEGFVRDLDVLAGIDAWHMVREDGLMRGIASRVQWGPVYRTFTIRAKLPSGGSTELHKRMQALERSGEGWLFPHLTCQAYLTDHGGPLLAVGVAKTIDILWLVSHGYYTERTCKTDGNLFRVVSWDVFREHGKRVAVLEGE